MYFHEIIKIHTSVETYTYHRYNSPYGTLMDGWRKTQDRIVISQSRVISECYVQASRPGLNQGLCRHHRAQVEGVEGPMGKVPQVVMRKGGMPVPHTLLQHLVVSEVLLEKETERYHVSHELEGQEQAVPCPQLVVFNISFLLHPAVTNNHSQRGQCAAVRSR